MARTQGVVLAQIPITFDIGQNAASIRDALSRAEPGDIVLTPEGSVSGYPARGEEEARMLGRIDAHAVGDAIDALAAAARGVRAHLVVGACLLEPAGLTNAAFVLTSDGSRFIYRKANLANVERGRFVAGDELTPVAITAPWGVVTVGVQICRELRFPEQWIALAAAGAELFLHPANALEGAADREAWRSMLIARATELQRFVVSVNAAGDGQHSPTMAVDPGGRVVCELPPEVEQIRRIEIDLDQDASDYLDQRRTDLTGPGPEPIGRPRGTAVTYS
jgi:predicted amidohydrolase